MATIRQQALRGLENAGYPTGTIGPAHAGLPVLGEHVGEKLVAVLLELDDCQAEALTTAIGKYRIESGRV